MLRYVVWVTEKAPSTKLQIKQNSYRLTMCCLSENNEDCTWIKTLILFIRGDLLGIMLVPKLLGCNNELYVVALK
jgi:hypothetical protein